MHTPENPNIINTRTSIQNKSTEPSNKEFILEVYEDLYKKNKRPRPLDYAIEIYRKKYDDNISDDISIKAEMQKKRVTIMRALTSLTEGDNPVLGIIDRFFYIPKRDADIYNSHQYLYNNLHPEMDHVFKLSKKVCILSLDLDKYEKASKSPNLYIKPQTTRSVPYAQSDHILSFPNESYHSNYTLSNHKERKKEIDISKEFNHRLSDTLEHLLDTSRQTSEMLHITKCILELQQEIYKLKAKVDELELKDSIEKEKSALINSIIDNLKMFIGHEYCYNIYRSQNNLIIMFELSKEDIDNGVDQELRNKLNELLQEIKNKPKPKVDFLTGKIYR